MNAKLLALLFYLAPRVPSAAHMRMIATHADFEAYRVVGHPITATTWLRGEEFAYPEGIDEEEWRAASEEIFARCGKPSATIRTRCQDRLMATETEGDRFPGEQFKHYVERQFIALHERLTNMTTLAEQLGVEEAVLATVIPALATEIDRLQQSIADEKVAKEAAVAEAKAAVEAAAADEVALAAANEALAAAEAELAAIQSVADKLAPVVAQAEALAPAPAGNGGEPAGGGEGAPAGGDPLPPPDGGGSGGAAPGAGGV